MFSAFFGPNPAIFFQEPDPNQVYINSCEDQSLEKNSDTDPPHMQAGFGIPNFREKRVMRKMFPINLLEVNDLKRPK